MGRTEDKNRMCYFAIEAMDSDHQPEMGVSKVTGLLEQKHETGHAKNL